MNAIAAAELRMLLRNRVVAGCAILLPLAFGIFSYTTRDPARPGGNAAGLLTVTMIAMGTYVTVTTTLAARRQTLYLKRMRGGAVTDRAIIAGLVSPVIVVCAAQVAVLLAVLAASDAPADPALLVAAIILAEAMFTGLALATAGFSTSPEHAQYTTTPLFFIATGAAIWYQATGTDELTAVRRILPGGALAELVANAWNGGSLANAALLLAICAAWTLVGILAARAWFRWEPRR